ncbi:MAG: HYR domain-containing protein, partial [Alphaproteobacteria bacterium]
MSAVAISCAGGSDGVASVVASGGTGAYSYAWSNSQNTAMATNLSAGMYTVTVTDANSCTATGSATITAPAGLTLMASSTAVNCFGGTDGGATVTVSGGTAPYQYLWSNGGNTATISGLTAGLYVVTVTDARSCTGTTQVAVSVEASSAMLLSVVMVEASCVNTADGSLAVTVDGGAQPLSYSWSNGGGLSLASGLSAGSYTVTVTDGVGCTASISETVTSVEDETAPVFTACPTNIVISSGVDECSAAVTYSIPTATDECGLSSLVRTSGPASGAVFSVGVTTVLYTATDLSGNTMECSFTVEVEDTQKPTAVCQNVTVEIGSDGTVTVTSSQLDGGSYDNCVGSI